MGRLPDSDDGGAVQVSPDPSWPDQRRAPGELERVRRFLNTVNLESGADLLATPQAAVEWLQRDHYSISRISQRDLRHLRDFREQLRLLVEGRPAGLSDHPLVMRSTLIIRIRGDQIALEPHGTGAVAMVEELLRIIANAQTADTWDRFTVCANPRCRWAFYDNSKNRRSRWCSMSVCGDRLKSRRYRARHGPKAGS